MNFQVIGRYLAGLPIRRKLIILHNLFFIVLVIGLYLGLRAPVNQIAARSAEQEADLLARVFELYPGAVRSVQSDRFTILDDKDAELIITSEMRTWLENNPGRVWQDRVFPLHSAVPVYRLIRFDTSDGTFQVIALSSDNYVQLSRNLRWMLGLVLLGIYALAVIALEILILPRYVYRPIGRILKADSALEANIRENELIDSKFISSDELGQIMTSRNSIVSLLRHSEGELKGALEQVEEMANDLKRKNHLLETAKVNLASQERLISLGLMSAGVAHEINTPLAVLRGSIEKMIEDPYSPESRERLQRMLRVTDRLRGISESLTDFARARNQKMECVSLRPLLDEAWSLASIEAGDTRIEFHNEAEVTARVTGNSGRLLQVFINLFKNGIFAIRDTARSGAGANGLIKVRSEEKGGNEKAWIVITIEDDGAGIPPDVLPRIFEPFVTSRLDSHGSGLGLAVTAGIIDQHGGLIVANNRPEKGARFEVTLPASR